MQLVRCMFYFEAQFHFELQAVYLLRAINTLADDLSCNQRSSFLFKAPEMQRELVHLSPRLPEVQLQGADWTYRSWTVTFSSIFTRA